MESHIKEKNRVKEERKGKLVDGKTCRGWQRLGKVKGKWRGFIVIKLRFTHKWQD